MSEAPAADAAPPDLAELASELAGRAALDPEDGCEGLLAEGADPAPILLCAALTGLARGASQDAFHHASTRILGGAPLIQSELIAARLSLIATEELTAELQLAKLRDLHREGAGVDQESSCQREIERAALVAVVEAAHVHGGHGFVQRGDAGKRVELAFAVLARLPDDEQATPGGRRRGQPAERRRDELEQAIRAATPGLEALLEKMSRQGRAADAGAEIPPGFFADLDVPAINRAFLPVEFGGPPILQGGVARCVLSEMLGYADPALAVALPGPSLALSPLLELGSEEQLAELLARFDGERPTWAAFAMTEPGGGSDATHIATTASRDGDGYRLRGEKCLIGNGGRASFIVVFATTDPARGQFGIQPFVVERDADGLAVDDSWPMLGLRAVRVAHLRLDDCWVPEGSLLGWPAAGVGAQAFLSAQRSWERMRPALAALIVGALERLLDELEALARAEGGRLLRRRAGALLERARPQAASARLLAHHAAALADSGEATTAQSSIAKATAARLARLTAVEALALVGAAGLREQPTARDLERWARDFQGFELLEGANEVHQLMIARGWSVRARRRRAAAGREKSPGDQPSLGDPARAQQARRGGRAGKSGREKDGRQQPR